MTKQKPQTANIKAGLFAKNLTHLTVLIADFRIGTVDLRCDSIQLIVLSSYFITKSNGQVFQLRHAVRHEICNIITENIFISQVTGIILR